MSMHKLVLSWTIWSGFGWHMALSKPKSSFESLEDITNFMIMVNVMVVLPIVVYFLVITARDPAVQQVAQAMWKANLARMTKFLSPPKRHAVHHSINASKSASSLTTTPTIHGTATNRGLASAAGASSSSPSKPKNL